MANRSKRSAGLLILSGRRILVLKRSARVSNPGTWGLPGGQRDRGEAPAVAARREAVEELGGLPPSHVVGALRVRRERAGRYDVLVCRAPAQARRVWIPRLCDEHTRYRWVRLEWLFRRLDRLHPVLRKICEKPEVMRVVCGVMDRDAVIEPVAPRRRRQTIVIDGAPVESRP